MKLTQNIFTLFLLYFAVVGFAFSQNKSLKEKNEKAEQKTLEVKANVMVLDAENKFIDDIKVEDLRIFEDGVEQKITRFAKRPEKLNLGIIVDNSGSMRYVLNEIISIGKSIVSNLQEDDEAFIIRFVSSDEIEVGVNGHRIKLS
jgi:Ca-activated chloride channel family protein